MDRSGKTAPRLLTRDAFREGVFARDGHRCVICRRDGVDTPAQDAHHIIERRLFKRPEEFGGYVLDNGASLCGPHHVMAETTELSVEEIREACGINTKVVPAHLYSENDQPLTKWGDPIMPNGMRLRGELFGDESVRKILAKGDKLRLYTHLVRFPRTWHAPGSPGMSDDDRGHRDLSHLEGREVVITVKRDGGNTTVHPTGEFHGRSPDAAPHPSQGPARAEAAVWQYNLPKGWRACLENLYRRHSIAYDDLPSWLLGFHLWDADNVCRPWDETLEWFELLGVNPVETIWRGVFDQRIIDAIRIDTKRAEGWVMRPAGEIRYGDYHEVAKWVRPDHNHLHGSRHAAIVPNALGPAGEPAWHLDAKTLGPLADEVRAAGWRVQ